MVAQNVPFTAFNRGLVTRLALARTDLKRTGLAAEVMTNWMPRKVGSMMLRPGTNFLGDTRADAPAKYLDFVFALGDTAALELTDSNLRIWVNDALVTRVAVATQTVNGTFPANLNNWTDLDEMPSAVSQWIPPNQMTLTGDGTNAAIREQQVIVAGGDVGKEHALRIIVTQGTVTLTVGSASGLDDYVNQTSLDVGTHSLAFTPAGNFWVRFANSVDHDVFVTNCTVEAAGALDLPTPWVATDLGNLRHDQSGDIVYIGALSNGAGVYQQRAIERRAAHSWSVVLYAPNDGPYLTENITPITLQAADIKGTVIVTSSKPIFKAGHLGALFEMTSNSQLVDRHAQGVDIATDPVKVTGVGADRNVTVDIGNVTASGGTIVKLERSADPAEGGWSIVASYNADQVATVVNDTFDNQIWYYRLHVTTFVGALTTSLQLRVSLGAIIGVVRVVLVETPSRVLGLVLKHLGAITTTNIWREGAWSTFRGFPTAPRFHQGRLTWSGHGFEYGSVSDGFYSFDDTVIGDSGPFIRSIGSGPVDNINWQLSLTRLIMGGDMAEWEVITSNLDEPITPTNFTIRAASTTGAAQVQALKIDKAGVYAGRAATRLYELALDPYSGDYKPRDLTAIVPELFNLRVPGTDISIVRMAVQRLPETRIHCVRADGQVGVLVFDKTEEVECWVQVQMAAGGVVEDVLVLPSSPEDAVYYVVRRVVNGATKRFYERWALESEARGATVTKLADACLLFQGAPTTIFAVPHLAGQKVAVWADGKDVGTNADYSYSLAADGAGNVTLATAASNVVIGLPYSAQWQSAKLAYAAQLGTALLQEKRVPGLGVIMADTHWKGLRYGKDFNTLDPLPLTEDLKLVAADSIWDEYDKPSFDFDGDWDTDSRVCVQAQSPRCCTLLGLVATIEMYEKT